jgi:deoxycytidine triphosphate deaminase
MMDNDWQNNGKSFSDATLTGDLMPFGGLLNNRLISKLHQDNELIINPWNGENLQIAQYALNPAQILYEDDDGIEHMHDLEKSGDYRFKPHEYAKVAVKQTIILPDGIVGRFIPASGLIEAGFGLTAGKLDPGYGAKREQIQFGIQNLRSRENAFGSSIPFTSRVAYIEFFDIRTLPVDPGELREYDYKIREVRRRRDEFAKAGIPDEF